MEDERNADPIDDSDPTDEAIPVDITKRRDELLVGADMPGFRKQDIDVSVRERSVTIDAERGSDAVTRTVDLPDPVVPKHVDASYDDGILWLTLRKRT